MPWDPAQYLKSRQELHEPYMASYRDKLRIAYAARPLPFTFRRIHFVATRPDPA